MYWGTHFLASRSPSSSAPEKRKCCRLGFWPRSQYSLPRYRPHFPFSHSTSFALETIFHYQNTSLLMFSFFRSFQ